MPATFPFIFADGPGNTASGVQVMSNLNAVLGRTDIPAGTSFPTSPYDGQDFFYRAADGVIWHFKYDASSASTLKWVCVGGRPLQAEVLTAEVRAAATYADLTTTGPSVTVPLAGDYDLTIEAAVQPGGVVNNRGWASPSIGGGTPSDNDAIVVTNPATGTLDASVSRTMVRTIAALAVVKMQYKSTGTNNMTFYNRHLQIMPRRVG